MDVHRRLRSRYVLVVGKGGVGKSTAAGALALGFADRGERVHLLSTDPAHSLRDLFGVDVRDGAAALPDGPVASPCTPNLLVEELDAGTWTRSRLARMRRPLQDLLDRGTLLDPEDVSAFLDLTLPGMDEVAAALRLAELAPSPADRIVVDTAPTGHTVRLLDAPRLLEGWIDAFEAMQQKAVAVAEALTRRRMEPPAAEVVAELREDIRTFQAAVLERGQAVVVDRGGAVVEAETARLLDTLEERGMRVGLRVRTRDHPDEAPANRQSADAGRGRPEAPDGVPLVPIPFRSDLAGCEGLRRWGEPEAREAAAAPHAAPPAPAPRTREDAPDDGRAVDRIRSLDVPLLLLVGKGGVGKSTWAAALALLRAEDGPVTLLGTDPAGSLHDLMELPGATVDLLQPHGPADGDEIRGVRVRQVRAEARYHEVRERYRRDVERAFEALSPVRHAGLDRHVVETLIELSPPGVDEIFSLAALLEDVPPGRTVVVDTAPTGHLLRLLALPEVALQWTRQLMRTLRKYRALRGLDGFSERLLDFAKQLKDLHFRLTDPSRSASIVVTQPGPLVAAETRRLLQGLREAEVRVAGLVRNRWPGGPGPDGGTEDDAFIFRAPPVSPPPVGPTALLEFTSTWVVER